MPEIKRRNITSLSNVIDEKLVLLKTFIVSIERISIDNKATVNGSEIKKPEIRMGKVK